MVITLGKTSCCPMWSVIILVINKSDSRCAVSDFVITRMITDRIGLHSVLLPLLIKVSVGVISFSCWLWLITPISTLIIRWISKTPHQIIVYYQTVTWANQLLTWSNVNIPSKITYMYLVYHYFFYPDIPYLENPFGKVRNKTPFRQRKNILATSRTNLSTIVKRHLHIL